MLSTMELNLTHLLGEPKQSLKGRETPFKGGLIRQAKRASKNEEKRISIGKWAIITRQVPEQSGLKQRRIGKS